MSGGCVWLVAITPRGAPPSDELATTIRYLLIGVILGSATLCTATVLLQLTREPWDDDDWTLSASIGAGAGLCSTIDLLLGEQYLRDQFPGLLGFIPPLL